MINKIDIRIKQIHKDSILPKYQSNGASGFDLHSVDDVEILSSQIIGIRTGLAFEIPNGFELQIRPRSGLAIKHGISVLNTPGTIDSDYRGEIIVILVNFSKDIFCVRKGDRVAQAILSRVFFANLISSNELKSSNRGNNGFGSTGI